jgi:hypothetical protein
LLWKDEAEYDMIWNKMCQRIVVTMIMLRHTIKS